MGGNRIRNTQAAKAPTQLHPRWRRGPPGRIATGGRGSLHERTLRPQQSGTSRLADRAGPPCLHRPAPPDPSLAQRLDEGEHVVPAPAVEACGSVGDGRGGDKFARVKLLVQARSKGVASGAESAGRA